MQTIEEYKTYTAQLEGEVGKWHEAYDALMIERNELLNKYMALKKQLEIERCENELLRANQKEILKIIREQQEKQTFNNGDKQ